MKKFIDLFESVDKFKKIDLKPLAHKYAKEYSHGPRHTGFIDKTGEAPMNHKPIHDAATKAGYKLTHKSPTKIGDKNYVYHVYTKGAGPYSEHSLTVTTHAGTGKVWNMEHNTKTDHS